MITTELSRKIAPPKSQNDTHDLADQPIQTPRNSVGGMSFAVIHTGIAANPIAARPTDADGSRQVVSVVTRMSFSARPQEVWNGLMFYEQIGKHPPWLLRLLLPVPVRTEGRKSEVGDEVKCHYVDGHLLKRVTQVTARRNYVFEIVDQNLKVGCGIRLLGGDYSLRELPDARTEVTLKTRYASPHRPRWLWERMEAAACHLFHRHILSAMRQKL